MNRLTIIFLCLVLCLVGIIVPTDAKVSAADTVTNGVIAMTIGSKILKVNDVDREIDASPQVKWGCTFSPIAPIVNALGGTIEWNARTRMVIIVLGTKIIVLTIGSRYAVVNAKNISIDSNPDLVPYVQAPGRTMLPVRFIGEQLGALVTWNSSLQQVTLVLKTTTLATTGQTFIGSGAPNPSLGAIGDIYIDTAAHDMYGQTIAADTLANSQVGGPSSGASNSQVGFKFMATTTDTLVSFREYWVDETHVGYGGGNGATIRVTLQTDDGSGFPSGTILATKDIVGPADGLQQYSFTSPPSLTAGVVYHLVHTNVDPNPTVNFVSVNSLWYSGAANSPRNPRFTDAEYGQTAKYGAKAWGVRKNYTPILLLTYSGGITQGMGYMEMSNDDYATINGVNHMARESFTVTGGGRTVSSASVRLRRSSGTGALVVRLETSGGSLIEAINVPAASIPISAPDAYSGAVWITATFLSSHTLVSGASYNLRLSTDSKTTYTLFTIRKGIEYGFADTSYFKDGSAFKTTNGSTWTNLGRVKANPPENDIQFCFDNVTFAVYGPKISAGWGPRSLLSNP